MDDDRVVISSGLVLTPDTVASRNFSSVFRGYDQSEVRAFLKRVADEMAAAAGREMELRQALQGALARAAHPEVNEEALTNALGEHAARLLTSAREAAAAMVGDAETRAARIIQEADGRIARMRAEADTLLARRTEEAERLTAGLRQTAEADARALRERARAEAEAEVESARAQAREMVNEARGIRERMLTDLTRRQRIAEAQIDQLRSVRQRLLQAYSVVRRTLDEATAELGRAESETTPVTDAVADDLASRPAPLAGARTGPPGALQAPPAAGGFRPGPPPPVSGADSAPPSAHPPPPSGPAPAPPGDDTSHGEAHWRPIPGSNPGVHAPAPADPPLVRAPRVQAQAATSAGAPAAPPVVSEPPMPEMAPPGPRSDERSEPTQGAFGGLGSTGGGTQSVSEPAVPSSGPSLPGTTVDELFARLRSSQAPASAPGGRSRDLAGDTGAGGGQAPPEHVVGAPADDGPETAPASAPASAQTQSLGAPADTPADRTADESALYRRDELLDPIDADLSRQLKRVLQDEQNEVLDRLRRQRRVAPAQTLPDVVAQTERYQIVAAPLLRTAAQRGASFAAALEGDNGAVGASAEAPSEKAAAEWAAELAVDIVMPLRERLEAALRDAESEQGDGEPDGAVADRLSASYRQWKVQQVEQVARHHSTAAFVRGVFGASPDGTALRWVVDDEAPCPDCDDNALAGPTPKGEKFPTGQVHPPAHPGCRCLLVTS